MPNRPCIRDAVEKYVNYHMARKKIVDKKKLYIKCTKNIPVCRNMSYSSFASIIRSMSKIEADSKNIKYVS